MTAVTRSVFSWTGLHRRCRIPSVHCYSLHPIRSAAALAATGALLVAGVPGVFAQSRPTCPQVISEVNRVVREQKGNPAGAREVADRLHTDVIWVQRCMQAYGRTPAKRIVRGDDDIDAVTAAVEEGESQAADRDEDGNIKQQRQDTHVKLKRKHRQDWDDEDDPFQLENGPLGQPK